MSGDRPSIAVVTPVFPNAAEPYRGIFNYRRILALQAHADVHVYCAMAAYPETRFLSPRARAYARVTGPASSAPGVDATYVSYPAFPVLSRPFNSFQCARRLRPLLRRHPPDLILAYWVHPEGRAAVSVGKTLGVPVVVAALGSDLRVVSDPLARWMIARTLREADHVVGVSDDLCRIAVAMGASPARVRTIHNGCDGTIFRPGDRGQARAELGVAPGDELVLFVGRFAHVKGVLELVDAAARLRSRARLRVALIGEGVLEGDIRNRVRALQVEGVVQLLGPRTPREVARWLVASNVLCLPSRSEGCPNALLEALHCGRPAVASDVGGIPELVDGECAILVPPGDVGALAEGLARGLTRSWDETAIARRHGRTWEDVGAETFEVCRSVLEQGPRKKSSVP